MNPEGGSGSGLHCCERVEMKLPPATTSGLKRPPVLPLQPTDVAAGIAGHLPIRIAQRQQRLDLGVEGAFIAISHPVLITRGSI